MHHPARTCPDCDSPIVLPHHEFGRRDFLKTAGAASLATVAAGAPPNWARAAGPSETTAPESLVKVLYDTLTPGQREKLCFDWDYKHPRHGQLRTRVANNWHITEPVINSDFFSADQKAIIRDIFEGIIQPDWHARIDRQLEDDAGGFGEEQNIAVFGTPGEGQFEFVMTGRHMTLRCDGNSADHLAFGGPIFYGHAANSQFNEPAGHEDNVFWPQALAANQLFTMLDGRQRKLALVPKLPKEEAVGFRAAGQSLPGIAVTELSNDQQGLVRQVLAKLIEPYRQSDRDEVAQCLKAQGGLDRCALAFYQEGDLGDDQVWDCWRLEGPAFVWYFRGTPHVHVWVNVADDSSQKTNTAAYV
ncbi:MAG TPA: DUF3500 domain-containing protein [Pirellulales bacterium]|nr:DUF3500 domain-containing protein [Pirellulales bacterium]